jgi:hypothetical protein
MGVTTVRTILFVACAVAFGTFVHVANCRTVILNEDSLIGTCTKTCATVPVLHDKFGCKRISGCSRSSSGWIRGFVRCDYCSCDCQDDSARKDVLVETSRRTFNEDSLYGTCRGKCYRGGLVRTNFKGCHRVEDCSKERTGWIRGFVRCNYCTCACVVERYPSRYRLQNVKYQVHNMKSNEGPPMAMAKTILEVRASVCCAWWRTKSGAKVRSQDMTFWIFHILVIKCRCLFTFYLLLCTTYSFFNFFNFPNRKKYTALNDPSPTQEVLGYWGAFTF